VVIFPNDIQPPEGSPVRVELISQSPAPTAGRSEKDDILFRMGEYAVETGDPDLAAKADHRRS
jgi:hypothetical protein